MGHTSHQNSSDLPSAVEMETLKESVLKTFEYVTREASGQNYNTISKIIPLLNKFRSQTQWFCLAHFLP